MRERFPNPSVPTTMLDAQSLWDATMADSIHKALDKVDRVVHVTGYFHVQYKLGLVEHLARLVPENDNSLSFDDWFSELSVN